MLVLSRKVNQTIKIGEDIEITVVSISGDNVRIGINAPKSYKVLRSEIYEEIGKQNREASKSIVIPTELQQLLNSTNANK
jgi:carbon storage regulator